MKKYRLACTDCDYVRETDDLASAIRQHLETCQRCDEGFILLDAEERNALILAAKERTHDAQ